MHVALFSPAWPLRRSHNGIVTFVHWMREELGRLGHRVSVFTPVLLSEDDVGGVHRVVAPSRSRPVRWLRRWVRDPHADVFEFGKVIARSILDVHRSDPIDLIEIEESFGWSADVEAITGVPVLVKLHGPAFQSLVDGELTAPFGIERMAREGIALARARAIAAPSADTLATALAHYRLMPPVAEHIVNPVDVDAEVPLWRLEDSDPNVLLFVGRFDRRKGADVLLEAFKLLLATRPALSLVFVGPDAGVIEADGSRIHIEAYLARLLSAEQRSRVDYRGTLPNHEIPALRCRARALVVASRWENQGYTLLEAMLQGCPVVASDVGGNPESVLHDRTGLLARSEDPADLARNIAILLDAPDTAARLGAAARRHVVEQHSVRRVAGQSLALYERVIANARGT